MQFCNLDSAFSNSSNSSNVLLQDYTNSMIGNIQENYQNEEQDLIPLEPGYSNCCKCCNTQKNKDNYIIILLILLILIILMK